MTIDVVQAEALPDYRLVLRFEDGTAGEVDVRALTPLDGIFAELRDPEYFARVEVNSELGCIYWPNGADLDPDVLYSAATGSSLPNFVPHSR